MDRDDFTQEPDLLRPAVRHRRDRLDARRSSPTSRTASRWAAARCSASSRTWRSTSRAARPGAAIRSYTPSSPAGRGRQHLPAQVTLPPPEILDQSKIRDRLHPGPVRGRSLPAELRLRLCASDTPLLEQPAAGPGVPALLETTAARPGRAAQRPDRGRSRRPHRQRQKGRSEDDLRFVPDAPVYEFTLDHERRSSRSASEQRQPLPREAARRSADRGHNGKTADQSPRLQVRGCGKARKKRSKRGHR